MAVDIENEIDLLRQKGEILSKNMEIAESAKKLQQDNRTDLEYILELNTKKNELDQEYFDILTQSDQALEKQLGILEKQLAYEEVRADRRQDVIDKLIEESLQMDIIIKKGEDSRKEIAKAIALRQNERTELEKTVGAAKNFGTRMKGLLGMGMEFNQTFIGGLAESGVLMTKLAGSGANLGAIIGGKLLAMGPQLFGLMATRTEELFTAMDGLQTGLVRATGASEQYRNVLFEGIDASRRYGLAIENVGSSMIHLYRNTVSFRQETDAGKKSMLLLTSTLEQAGITSESTTKSIHILSKALNISGEAAATEASKMVSLAQSLSLPIDQVMQDFQAASSVIAAHGDNMMQVFSELSAAASATGMSMSELVSIASQFDTFDSSASAVGRLNSILGGPYLNSVEMVYASESERIRAMIQSIELSGTSWQSMGRLEKKALASAAGITDMAQANELFGSGLAAYDDAQLKAELMAPEQERLAQLAKDSTAMMANLSNALNGLAISMAPLINVFRVSIDLIAGFLNLGDGLVSKVLVAVGAIILLGKAHAAYNAISVITIARGGLLAIKQGLVAASAMAAATANFALQLSLSPLTLLFGAAQAAMAIFSAGSLSAAGSVTIFGVAFNIATLGIPLLIGAIIAVIGALVYYWDDLVAAFGNGWSGITDLFATGGEFIKNMFSDMGSFFIGLADIWFFPMRVFLNGLIQGVNLLIKGMNMIPGVNLPTIDFVVPSVSEMVGMQDGGVLKQGQAKVAEAGKPEMIENTSKGTVVTPLGPNAAGPAGDFMTGLAGSMKALSSAAFSTPAPRSDQEYIAAVKENTATMKRLLETPASAKNDKPIELVVQMGLSEVRAAGKMINGALANNSENDLRLRYGVT